MSLRGAIRGLGQGMAQYGQQRMSQLMSDESAQMRSANMAKYRREEMEMQQQHQIGMATDSQKFQRELAGIQGENSAEAARITAEGKATAAEKAHEYKLLQIAEEGKLNPSATKIVNNIGADSQGPRTKKMQEALGSADAEMFDSTRKAVMDANSMEDSLSVIEDIQSSFETGRMDEAMAKLGQWTGTDSGGALQAWQGTVAPIVLKKAESMSGVLSDKDMAFLTDSVPKFGNEPEANKIMIGLLRKAIVRSRENYDSMQKHVNKNGNLNGWEAPNQQGVTPLGQQSIDAANNPAATLTEFDKFNQWKASK